jgi:hypothetical protein
MDEIAPAGHHHFQPCTGMHTPTVHALRAHVRTCGICWSKASWSAVRERMNHFFSSTGHNTAVPKRYGHPQSCSRWTCCSQSSCAMAVFIRMHRGPGVLALEHKNQVSNLLTSLSLTSVLRLKKSWAPLHTHTALWVGWELETRMWQMNCLFTLHCIHIYTQLLPILRYNKVWLSTAPLF